MDVPVNALVTSYEYVLLSIFSTSVLRMHADCPGGALVNLEAVTPVGSFDGFSSNCALNGIFFRWDTYDGAS